MTHRELWALLSGPPGWHRFEVARAPGVYPNSALPDVAWVPVDDPDRFERVCRAGGRVGLIPYESSRCDTVGLSSVLWCVASTPAQREAVEHFAPAPTVVVAEGATWTALWALEQPLTLGWTEALNKRLAHRLGTKLVDGRPWQTVGIPGSTVGRITVEALNWSGGLHSARRVAGDLDDPVDHRAAWKARQAAA